MSVNAHEAEQRYLAQLYQILINNLADYSIFLIDADGIVMTWNPGSERMFGYSPEEIVGRDVAILFTEEDRFHNRPQIERDLARTKGRAEDERWHLHKSGERLFVSGMVFPIIDEGNLVAFAKIGRDRTEKRRLEQELRDANAAKDDFLAVVSHELRTPLTATLGWAQLARYTNLDPATVRTALEAIERTTKLQAQLVDDLLDVARVTAGKLQIDKRPIDLTEVIDAAANAVMSLADPKNLSITTKIEERPIFVLGDSSRLQQVFWNLLSNAAKFTPAGGEVRVLLTRTASSAVLTVTDTGEGISAEFLPYVFDRFRQAGTPRTRTFGGLGLGLAIVRHIIESLGGRVAARSGGEGHGAEFLVELPLLSADALAALQASDLGRAKIDTALAADQYASISGMRVLLVEDEVETRTMLAALLAKTGAWYRVADGGRQAIQLFIDDPPEIVISDIAMPEMDGYALLQELRRIEEERGLATTPVIALTALTSPEERARLLEAGFHLHVGKPVNAAELLAAIHGIVERERE